MASNARDERLTITPDQARHMLAALPDGTYTLRDMAVQWPGLLPAAMVLCDEATRSPRPSWIRGEDGQVALDQESPGKTHHPHVRRWSGDAFSIHVRSGQPALVTIACPADIR